MYVAKSWQLASCQSLLTVACQPDIFKGPKRRKLLAPIPPSRLAFLRNTELLRDLMTRPVTFISLHCIRSTRLSSDLQEMSTWSDLSPPSYGHLTAIFLRRDTSFCATVVQVLIWQWGLRGSLMYTNCGSDGFRLNVRVPFLKHLRKPKFTLSRNWPHPNLFVTRNRLYFCICFYNVSVHF